MDPIFSNYPIGSNLTILNTIYHRPQKDPDTEKWDNGAITIIARDLDTGKKLVTSIDNPWFEYYVVKPEYEDRLGTYYHSTYPLEWLTLRACRYRDLHLNVATYLGRKAEYFESMKYRDWKKRVAEFHADNRIVRSTMNISDFYRYQFDKMYRNEPYPLRKGYFDIEVDVEKSAFEFPESGECPVNSVSFIDSASMTVYVFLLEDHTNPQYYQFKEEVEADQRKLESDIYDNILKAFGGDESKMNKFNLYGLKFKFMFYTEDKEADLIRDLFRIMCMCDMDFVMAWNMKFDVPYLIDRCAKLGYKPYDIICDPNFKYAECWYYVDTHQRDDYHLRSDYANISLPFVLNDQLLTFAGRRKSNVSSLPNLKLDTIAELTAGIHKLDYHQWTSNIKYLPKLNYRIFVIYNIIDTVNQMCIEETERDIDFLFALALESNTRYSKFNKPSVVLYNEANKLYEQNLGIIPGNNINLIFTPTKERYDGAFVSEPRLLDDDPKISIYGMPIPICDNVADMDFSSMYPSEAINFNMSNETQIGRIMIPRLIRRDEAVLHNKSVDILTMSRLNEADYEPPQFNRSGAFVEDYSAQSWLIFGHRWFNLKDFKELLEFVAKYFTKYRKTNATLRDFSGKIIETRSKIDRVPWCIDPSFIYGELYTPTQQPHDPVTDEMREKVNEFYNRRKHL